MLYLFSLGIQDCKEGGEEMKNAWKVTYETITPESAENGETEDSGFLLENGSFRGAMALTYEYRCEGGIEANNSSIENARWFTWYKTNEDYATGETENRSLHIPDHITRASRLRIARLIGAYGI
jgi:hypothetical protein